MEKRYRSILKGFTWRILATLSTIIISWIITGEIDTAISIGFIEFFAKMALYYAHERVWIKINIGKEKPVEYDI